MKKKQNKRRCLRCRDYFNPSTGLITNAGFFCTFEHASEYGRAKHDKELAKKIAKKHIDKKEKDYRKQRRIKKEALKTVSDLTKEAQASINAFVRVRDYGKPCVSCGSLPQNKLGGSMDCGHYRSRGAAGHLRFNLFNMAAQCVKCNRYGSGNAVDYRIELIKRIGLERVERLEHDNKERRYSKDYLRRIKTIFNKRTRIYKKLLRSIE